MSVAGAWLREELNINPVAVGHRVVHGGPDYANPVLIDHGVVGRLERYVSLAPLHQPHNLAPIKTILNNFPALPQVACFDTAFHRDHNALADHYAIPYQLHAEGIRRYGFHGLSYEYIAKRLPQVAPDVAGGRVIVAHLGSGASMGAIKNGKSVESTMGFTALDGLAMGTRVGQLDPGVVLYLIAEKGMSVSKVQDFLYRDCGLKGLSGVSNDMRELESSGDPRAAFAIDYFVYRGYTPACSLPRCRVSTPSCSRPESVRTRHRFGRALSRDLPGSESCLIRQRMLDTPVGYRDSTAVFPSMSFLPTKS
jgi:acetate kinase